MHAATQTPSGDPTFLEAVGVPGKYVPIDHGFRLEPLDSLGILPVFFDNLLHLSKVQFHVR